MHRMKEAVGDTTALYGLICGPFTLASHLRGNNLFTDMFDFEEEVESLFAFCNRVCMKMADYYIEAGMDVIALVDPLISQISTAHFEQYMTEPYTELFDHIRAQGACPRSSSAATQPKHRGYVPDQSGLYSRRRKREPSGCQGDHRSL